MDFMTITAAAEKWELTERMVQYYCKAGRINGAVKMAGVWLLPKDADQPNESRIRKKGQEV